jgi:hypothetical protein
MSKKHTRTPARRGRRQQRGGVNDYAACLSVCLTLALALGLCLTMQEPNAKPAPRPVASTQPVKLYRDGIDVASLTPGCDVHDWTCVIATEHQQKGRKP